MVLAKTIRFDSIQFGLCFWKKPIKDKKKKITKDEKGQEKATRNKRRQ
jgi:hypothetical protein